MMDEQNTSFQIRAAASADNFLLAEVGAETFFDTFAVDNTPENMAAYLAASFSPEKQAEELADPATKFLLIELKNQRVGFARLKFGQAPAEVLSLRPMEIVRIYVRKNWIGFGAGGRLIQACLDEAAHAGCDKVWLDVWEYNDRAIAFYRKWGFEKVGIQAFKLGDELQNDLVMVRPVNIKAA